MSDAYITLIPLSDKHCKLWLVHYTTLKFWICHDTHSIPISWIKFAISNYYTFAIKQYVRTTNPNKWYQKNHNERHLLRMRETTNCELKCIKSFKTYAAQLQYEIIRLLTSVACYAYQVFTKFIQVNMRQHYAILLAQLSTCG